MISQAEESNPKAKTHALVRYDAMCRAIDAAYEVDEVKAIHDQAQRLQAAARVAGNVEAETKTYQIRWRAAKKGGELSKQIPKAQGQRSDLGTSGGKAHKLDVLKEAGIAPRQASDWERLSDVPDDEFETALATKSVRELIEKPTPVSDDALLFIGTIRDFERRGYLARTPADFMKQGMTSP